MSYLAECLFFSVILFESNGTDQMETVMTYEDDMLKITNVKRIVMYDSKS